LRVLADRTFAIGTLLISIMGFGLYGSFVLLTFYLDTRLTRSPPAAPALAAWR
jgi:hypothetical protein